MSKELNALECLEALERDIKDRTILAEDRQLKLCAVIKQALLELQSIKEANPSEALECLDKLVKQIELDEDTDYWEIRNAHITVEQALLKARKQENENELLKEIIKSFFDKGCPLHQYTDKEGILQIEVDDECSIMHLGKFNGIDLDKFLKEVLE